VEQGWNLDEYLDYICVKAGLPQGAYNASDTQLHTFTAAVFGEEYWNCVFRNFLQKKQRKSRGFYPKTEAKTLL
jgi:AMMECR1 domain-containing protein